MKNIYTTILISCFFLTSIQKLSSQNISDSDNFTKVDRCETDEYTKRKIQKDPNYLERVQLIEEKTQAWIKNENGTVNPMAIVTIPVVLHVVYKNSTENIPDNYLQQQIDRLNLDYSITNTDWSNTPAVFQAKSSDTQIQFCLASKDVNGSPVSGIVRTSTTVNEFSSWTDDVKFTANGGSDAWDTQKYLNIWICDLGSQKLGYATGPGWGGNDDGVVVHYGSIPGPPTVFQGRYDMGRTASHEVGHWLGLSHIWGDAGGGCGDDFVSDTPTQFADNDGCPSFPKVSCSNGPDGEMFMNYMDYVHDKCMIMFSTGQGARMRAAINSSRSGLLNSSSTDCSTLTTTVGENIKEESISIFPNPSTGKVIIATSLDFFEVNIYNAIGELVLSKNVSAAPSNQLALNLDNFLNGIYLVEIKTDNESIIKKLMINK